MRIETGGAQNGAQFFRPVWRLQREKSGGVTASRILGQMRGNGGHPTRERGV
jgi:hypothetical protein